MQGTILAPNGNCYYDWIKKNGTTYEFYIWNYSSSGCGGNDGQNGRLSKIWERNNNNYISLNYHYDGSGTTSQNISEIDAVHQDGHQLTLTFGNWNGHRELSSITRPNSNLNVTYWYDSSGNLTDVCEPGNGSFSTTASSPCSTGQRHHQYAYSSGTHQLAWVNSPNWVMTNYECGTYQSYNYDGANRITSLADNGTINPYIADGTQGTALSDPDKNPCVGPGVGQPLQSSTLGELNYTADYGNTQTQYYVLSFGGWGSSTTSATDSNGHSTSWSLDASGRVTQANRLSGPSAWIISSAVWDSENDLIETTDARGNATDYAYDANGNVIAIATPAVNGVRATSLYSYDLQTVNGSLVNYNNITAYCDPASVGTAGYDWSNRPQNDSLCTAATARRQTWDHSYSDESYGRLTDSYAPNGYHVWYSYSSGVQGGDFGLPSDAYSTCISQKDGSQRCPHQHFTYDPSGNLTSYSAADNEGAWTLSYDSFNRPSTVTDPTNATNYSYYNDDGSINSTETAYQHATGTGPQKAYDADGNVISESVEHGGAYNSSGSSPALSSLAKTYKFYDGADRLIEVILPRDTADVYTTGWITRYVYDISGQGGAAVLSFRGQSLNHPAYGNLWKTQEWLPASIGVGTAMSADSITPTAFLDQKAQTFDAMDRVLTKTQLVNQGSTEALNTVTNTYDGNTYTGMLSKTCNALLVCSVYAYDDLGRTSSITFTDGSTPSRQYTYDLDGRALTMSNVYGSKTYQYDSYGQLTQSVESLASANGVALSGSATLTYHYYEDGRRSALDVATSGSGSFAQSSLFAYAYRNDGALQWQQINDANIPQFTGGGSIALAMAYDNAGRLTSRSESGTGANATPISITYNGFGMATTKAYPGGTLSNIQYDAGGAPLGYSALPAGQTSAQTNSYNYTVRGELSHIAPYGSAAINSTFANGIAFSAGNCWCSSNPYKTIDTAMAVTLATNKYSGATGGANDSDSSVGFDAAGRMTDESTTQTDSNMQISASTDAQRQYDAENHLVEETYSSMDSSGGGGNAIAQYAWGGTGQLIAVGSSFAATGQPSTPLFDTLHWDGGELLFTTNQQGYVDDIKVGDLADITPSHGIVFYDRAFGSDVSFCHSATAVAGSGSASPYSRVAAKFGSHPSNPCGLMSGTPSTQAWSGDPNGNPTANGVGNGGILALPHGDGISDGFNTIQGVRSFSAASGVWVAPDAFSGSVSDPSSQKSYIWNQNNPISYSDPSGYASTIELLEVSGGDIDNFDNIDTAFAQAQARATTGNGSSPTQQQQQQIIAAAAAAGAAYASSPNDKGPHHGDERGTSIVQNDKTGDISYVPLGPDDGWGTKDGWDPQKNSPPIPAGTHVVGYWHVHPDLDANTSPRASMLGHPGEVGIFGHPIFTSFSDYKGVLFVQWTANFNDHPLLVRGSLPYDPRDPYQYEPGH
jgi:YD repeat-containing protein